MNLPHRHVAKTGDIKDFIITEESGIAKGIRRIVAITGHEAAEAHRRADALAATLARLESMRGGEKDAGLKSLTVVCLHKPVVVHRYLQRSCRNSDKQKSLCSGRRSFGIVLQ